jgi:2-polyprenyl-6-methoxyphenol hydroxylase-like FAD-dependent oxidoreductase
MANTEQTQVLVAGGGPVGLLAALCAAKRGLDVIVIERNFRGTPRGHTTLLHPSSMRLLADLGLAPLLLRAGQLLDQVELSVDSGRQLLNLPFPALSVTQAVFEEALLQVLHKEEIDLRATCEVTAISQTENYVEVATVRREQIKETMSSRGEHWEVADSHSIRAAFVIGADGHGSQVRQSLGIGTVKSPAERYAMFEFPSDRQPEPELVIQGEFAHAVTPLVDRRTRCSFQLAPSSSATADLELLATLLAQRAPHHEAPRELYWSQIIDFEPAVAHAFGRGRVWLAGDAAHSACPLGVQSMNGGLSEAWQLLETMAAVNAGQLTPAALELLGSAQRRDWLRAVSGDFELLPHAPAWLSGHARQVVAALPASGPDLEALLRQLGLAAPRAALNQR